MMIACTAYLMKPLASSSKFDPTNPDITSTVGGEAEEGFDCGNGVLGGNGYIYAANESGQVLKVHTTSNNYTWIGDPIY
jgi:hypothetical protein